MSAKITFDFINARILVEGKEEDLLKLAQEAKALAPKLSEIRIIIQSEKPQETISTPAGTNTPAIHTSRKQGIREFARSLPLATINQKIAALAYHAIKLEGKPYFSVKEMSNWFTLCGFPKPAIMAVAMSDAKKKDYVVSKGRDQWTITTGGENFIISLTERQF